MFVLCIKCLDNIPKQSPEDLVPIILFLHPLQPLRKSLMKTVQNLLKEFSYPVLQFMFRNVWSILELQMVFP